MANAKKSHQFDSSFYTLANDIAKCIARNKNPGHDQKRQLNDLLDAEKKLKAEILKFRRQSREIYKKFLQKITITNGNILSARPYFRESSVNFSKYITPAIKTSDIEKMKTFTVNYLFLQFCHKNWLGPFPEKAEILFKKVEEKRRLIIENNMPLAVNRAKLFYRKTPRSHLDLMDLIIISGFGLCQAIDKWSAPEHNKSFAPMIVGRIIGPTIEAYSSTVLHFYPNDKKIIYRANSIRGRQGIVDITELTKAVNDSFMADKAKGMGVPPLVTISQLSELMQASSTVSADTVCDDSGTPVYGYTASDRPSAEVQFIEAEEKNSVYLSINKLELIQKKILKLKGIRF
jgi:DNA-directed RNA polymerase specialized sigma subunit